MNEYRFHVQLGVPDVLSYYQGKARHVRTLDQNGMVLQLPLAKLQPFITPDGIHGDFLLVCDSENKFVSIDRI